MLWNDDMVHFNHKLLKIHPYCVQFANANTKCFNKEIDTKLFHSLQFKQNFFIIEDSVLNFHDTNGIPG